MKLNFQLSQDWPQAWWISQHPSVVEGVTNDEWGAMPANIRAGHIRTLVENPYNRFYVVFDEDQGCITVGGFLFELKSPGIYEVHTMLFPICRGVHAIELGKRLAKHMLEQPGVIRLISQCPMNHREILFFALKCGFHKAETIARGWMKAGQSYPLQMVELNKKDLCLSQ